MVLGAGTIKKAFVNHFEARFKEHGLHRFKINVQFPKKLIQNQADDLERVVSRDEIRLTVWNCGDNKSPGPHGYSFEFLKKYWDFIGSDLCEGDPLAPYLFILVIESLHLSIRHLVDNGEWSEENLKVILNALKCFFLASGLCINIHKSQLLGVGIPYQVVQHAAYSIGFSIMQNQFRYLGVTIGDRMTRIKVWENVIAKLRSRLSKWKVKTLFIGGRLTLLKSILGASPIYSMSIFKVPCGVLKIMEAIRSRFFNGIGQKDSKITWIAWNKALASKKRGGLGGPKIDAHTTHTSSNWCAIVRELHSLKDKGFDFWSHCKKRIGNGIDTSFWYDCWIDDSALHIKFSRLFALELDKDISVAGKMNSQIEPGRWFCGFKYRKDEPSVDRWFDFRILHSLLGQLVQDPLKRNDVESLFEQARRAGAKDGTLDQHQPSSSSKSFSRRGRLLSGKTPLAAPQQQPELEVHTITYWTNGFTVKDDPLSVGLWWIFAQWMAFEITNVGFGFLLYTSAHGCGFPRIACKLISAVSFGLDSRLVRSVVRGSSTSSLASKTFKEHSQKTMIRPVRNPRGSLSELLSIFMYRTCLFNATKELIRVLEFCKAKASGDFLTSAQVCCCSATEALERKKRDAVEGQIMAEHRSRKEVERKDKDYWSFPFHHVMEASANGQRRDMTRMVIVVVGFGW
nr:hypothetical protein [Tanacetum cinerariifolium]